MRAVAEALRRVGQESNIPLPWSSLGSMIAPLRGQLCIVLAEPGIGKSAFSLNWAAKITRPSLVLSLDTDLGTQAIRLASLMTQTKTEDVKHNPDVWANWLMAHAQHVRMYDLSIESRDLSRLVEAEAEYWGQVPDLVVVDNVGNLVREGSYEEHRAVFSDLHRIARRLDTFVVALHHTRRGGTRGGTPQMASGLYGGEQEAEILLGLSRGPGSPSKGILNCSVLKNRSGNADSNGGLYARLFFNRETMEITDLTQHQAATVALAGMNEVKDVEQQV